MSKKTEQLRRMNGPAMRDHLKLLREVQKLHGMVKELEMGPRCLINTGEHRLIRNAEGKVWLVNSAGEMMECSETMLAQWLARLFKEEF